MTYTQKEYAAMADAANRQGKLLEMVNGELVPVDPPAQARDIKCEIAELEGRVTARRLREAVLGDEDAITFIENIETQIAGLRELLA